MSEVRVWQDANEWQLDVAAVTCAGDEARYLLVRHPSETSAPAVLLPDSAADVYRLLRDLAAGTGYDLYELVTAVHRGVEPLPTRRGTT